MNHDLNRKLVNQLVEEVIQFLTKPPMKSVMQNFHHAFSNATNHPGIIDEYRKHDDQYGIYKRAVRNHLHKAYILGKDETLWPKRAKEYLEKRMFKQSRAA